MKKLLVLCLCLGLCLPVTACGGSKEASATLHTETLGNNLDSAKFMVDDQEFSFPSAMSDWTDHGWHVSNNYGNKNSFTLEPMVETTTFELYKDDTQNYVRMTSYNDTDENVKIEGGITAYLRMTFSSKKDDLAVELPGGVTYKSKMDDVIAAYGEPVEKDDDELSYTYDTGEWICNVQFQFAGDRIVAVEYALSDDNWGSVATPEACEQYIDDALKASFYGDFTGYVENKFDTEEGARELYENEVEYYTEALMYYLDINFEIIDEEIMDGYRELTKQVFAKFKWDTPVYKENKMTAFAIGDAVVGDMELTLYPTDFVDIIFDDAQAVVDEFQANHSDVDPDSLSDEEYAVLENEYATNMLNAISPRVSEISYRDPVIKTYEIDTHDNPSVLSEDDWNEIDDILMDFGSSEE